MLGREALKWQPILIDPYPRFHLHITVINRNPTWRARKRGGRARKRGGEGTEEGGVEGTEEGGGGGHGRGGGGYKFYTGMLYPEVQTLALLYPTSDQMGTPFITDTFH